ncbi:MAG: HAD-IC family P-type ATPase, partial [Desulfomonilaceae bacterium]
MIEGIDLNTTPHLSEIEAALRLKEQGHNELPSSKKRSFWEISLNLIREPMFVLLVGCAAIYFLLGNPKEAFILLGFVIVVLGITLHQERKAERALDALRDLSSPRALVVRDNQIKRISGRDVVCDDLVVLSEGDRIPADGVLLYSLNLSVDESILTGESAPVRKISQDDTCEMKRPGGEDHPCVYFGTLVVQGRGIARVRATGIHTEMGRIGKALHGIVTDETAIQKETGRLVRNLAIFGLTLCILVVVIFGLNRGTWLNAVLAGITLAMAMLPEEFPVVLTIFFALGAWRISQKQVLTRRVAAIETLGAATVLCVDKTGTLTLNQMSVKRLFANGELFSINQNNNERLPEEFHELVEFGILAGNQEPFDPMEKALKALGETFLLDTEHLHKQWELVHEYPMSREVLSISYVWRSS